MNINYLKQKYRLMLVIFWSLFVLHFLSGCAGGAYGKAKITKNTDGSYFVAAISKTAKEAEEKWLEGANEACLNKNFVLHNKSGKPDINKQGGNQPPGQTHIVNGVPVFIPGAVVSITYYARGRLKCNCNQYSQC